MMVDAVDSAPDNEPFELATPAVSEAPPPEPPAVFVTPVLADATDAATFEAFVAPRWLERFAELAVAALAPSEAPRLAHLVARTGFPERALGARLPGARVFGVDPSVDAVHLANVKAAAATDLVADYAVAPGLPTPLAAASFSHALAIHPVGDRSFRRALLEEMHRLLVPGGQAVVALPVRGSYLEIYDLLREHAAKSERVDVEQAVARAVDARPTAETLSEELAEVGFEYVDVELRPVTVSFGSAERLLDDPTMRLMVLPDALDGIATEAGARYLREAAALYWSDAPFTLSVSVACGVGRKALG